MEAGRKLDARVAEQVMGEDPNWHEQVPLGRVTPHYSTDIAAAWEVVGEMAGHGLCLALHRLSGGRWFASFNPPGVHFEKHGTEADTAPHAICLAALKAVNAKEAA